MIAARDPYGFRPLVMGKIGDSPVFASESCAFDLIEADFEREVEPGEIIASKRWMELNHLSHLEKLNTHTVYLNIYILPDLTAL